MKKTTPTLLLGAVAVTAALTLTGCVNPVDAVVDRVLEGQGVDVDQKDGTIKIEGEDGENLVIGGTDVPEEFPSELPLPSVQPTGSFSGGGSVTMSFEGLSEEDVEALSVEIEALGYERVSNFTAEGAIMRTWENEQRTVSIIWDGNDTLGSIVYSVIAKG